MGWFPFVIIVVIVIIIVCATSGDSLEKQVETIRTSGNLEAVMDYVEDFSHIVDHQAWMVIAYTQEKIKIMFQSYDENLILLYNTVIECEREEHYRQHIFLKYILEKGYEHKTDIYDTDVMDLDVSTDGDGEKMAEVCRYIEISTAGVRYPKAIHTAIMQETKERFPGVRVEMENFGLFYSN
jgi:hypothetical protein